MTYWENSLIYKIISGSWFIGWLVSPPGDRSYYYKYSFAYIISNSLLNYITALLQRFGSCLNSRGKTSLFITNPLGFIGLLIFFYCGFDIILNDYNFKRNLLEGVLAIIGLFMLFLKLYPSIYQGCIIYRLFAWWGKTE
jgi:hypothetical protein